MYVCNLITFLYTQNYNIANQLYIYKKNTKLTPKWHFTEYLREKSLGKWIFTRLYFVGGFKRVPKDSRANETLPPPVVALQGPLQPSQLDSNSSLFGGGI